jgi:hypothetical protein
MGFDIAAHVLAIGSVDVVHLDGAPCSALGPTGLSLPPRWSRRIRSQRDGLHAQRISHRQVPAVLSFLVLPSCLCPGLGVRLGAAGGPANVPGFGGKRCRHIRRLLCGCVLPGSMGLPWLRQSLEGDEPLCQTQLGESSKEPDSIGKYVWKLGVRAPIVLLGTQWGIY